MAKTAPLLVLVGLLSLGAGLPAGAMVPRTRLLHEVDVPLELHSMRVRKARAMLHSAGLQLFVPGELRALGTHRGAVLCDGDRVVYPRRPSAEANAFCQ